MHVYLVRWIDYEEQTIYGAWLHEEAAVEQACEAAMRTTDAFVCDDSVSVESWEVLRIPLETVIDATNGDEGEIIGWVPSKRHPRGWELGDPRKAPHFLAPYPDMNSTFAITADGLDEIVADLADHSNDTGGDA